MYCAVVTRFIVTAITVTKYCDIITLCTLPDPTTTTTTNTIFIFIFCNVLGSNLECFSLFGGALSRVKVSQSINLILNMVEATNSYFNGHKVEERLKGKTRVGITE